MKTIIYIIFLLLSITINAQYIKPTEVPKNVKEVLDSIYPNNKLPTWKTYDKCLTCLLKYEATFNVDHKRNWVTIDSLGRVLSIEKDIEQDSLPAASLKYIDEHYERNLIVSTRKVLNENRYFYFAGLRGTKLTYNLLFRDDGTIYKEKNNFVGILLGASLRTLLIEP